MNVLNENQMNYNSIKQSFDDIIKSSEDKRQYKAFILNNGLKVLLISDVDTDKSAAALDVNIGHMSDPRHVQGLAHLLEHMLFLGTKKYPEENDYTQYLSRNGGSDNASTSESNTTYYFDVTPESLSSALDRFAQFFIEPLLTATAIDRELNAVNSEHENNLDNDSFRFNRICKVLSDPGHDYNKFGTGNVETLKEIPLKEGTDVRQALLDFHNKWYSANIMSLVVLGKETISELIEAVVPLFSQINNNNVTAPEWPTHPYNGEYLGKLVQIVPINDEKTMKIIIPIPDIVSHFKSLPGNYISHLIGHEGPGSLLSELRSQGLCSSLGACHQRGAKGFAFYCIYVDLTVDGIERTDQIIELIFQYINLLKNEGPKQWIYEEECGLRTIEFHFEDKEEPIDYVTELVAKLHDYPLSRCLSANNLIEEYRPDLITEMLDLLAPNNMQVMIEAKKFAETTDQTEKWYGIQYKVETIAQNKIDLWSNCGLNEKLSLPAVNDFIPKNFELTKREEKAEEFPQMIRNTDFCRLWYLQDNYYLKPKVYYSFKLTNPMAYSDPFNTCAIGLFASLFEDALEEYAYAAQLSGLFFSLNNTTTGMKLEMGGYNDKLNVFLKTVLKRLIDFKIDVKRFEIIQEKYIQNLRNYPLGPMEDLLQYYTSLVTTERYWSYEDLLNVAPDVTLESLEEFIPRLLSRFHIEALIYGNIEKSEALKVCDLFEGELKGSSYQSRPILHQFRNRQIQLKDGSEYTFETKTAVHQTNAIQMYFQIGVSEDRVSDVSLQLVNQLLSEPFYNTLRTKEQLGYLIWSTLRPSNGVLGMCFLIQSDYKTSYLNERIEAFISWSEQYLTDMTSEDFESEKQSLISCILEKPKQLLTYSSQLWTEIDSKQYNFNREQNDVNAIKQLTKEDILLFFKKYFSIDSQNRKKLTVSISSDNPIHDKDGAPNKEGLLPTPKLKESVKIDSIYEFKNMSALYPLPQPFIDVHNIKI